MATGLGRQKSHKQKVCIWNESNVIEMISKFGWKYKFDFLRGDCCPATFDWSIKWPCHVQFELQIRSLLFCLFLCVCVCVCVVLCSPLLLSPSLISVGSWRHCRWPRIRGHARSHTRQLVRTKSMPLNRLKVVLQRAWLVTKFGC